jgi:1-deoxy-D-xylulose-5-phosphate reductoisomerase
MTRVALLGATGSIGNAALDLARAYPDRIRLVSLAARSNDAALVRAAEALGARRIALVDPEAARRARAAFRGGEVLEGEDALVTLAEEDGVDVVVNAVVGGIGLRPTVAALERGKRVALANKESVVMAGELLTGIARRSGGVMLPVDSEHSGVFQCLEGRAMADVRRVTLTASGGPFLRRDPATVADATPEEVLRHPTWSMGERITVDCATLINKGFEFIEARWLFGLTPEQLDVVVHPQSIVHALVEFVDGSVVAQLSRPDMRLPLLYALSYPERWSSELPRLTVADLASLSFEPPDPKRSPGLTLARRALTTGGVAPAILNAADEEAVRLFLGRTIRFGDLMPLVEEVLSAHRPGPEPLTLESIQQADRWARSRLLEAAASMTKR